MSFATLNCGMRNKLHVYGAFVASLSVYAEKNYETVARRLEKKMWLASMRQIHHSKFKFSGCRLSSPEHCFI